VSTFSPSRQRPQTPPSRPTHPSATNTSHIHPRPTRPSAVFTLRCCTNLTKSNQQTSMNTNQSSKQQEVQNKTHSASRPRRTHPLRPGASPPLPPQTPNRSRRAPALSRWSPWEASPPLPQPPPPRLRLTAGYPRGGRTGRRISGESRDCRAPNTPGVRPMRPRGTKGGLRESVCRRRERGGGGFLEMSGYGSYWTWA